jgi:replicative DNA helicase
MGKSAFALSMALKAARQWDSHIAIFSLEMSAEQLVQRMLAVEGRVDVQKLRLGRLDGDEWRKIAEAAGRLSELMVFIDDSASLSAMEMRSKARRVHAEHRLDLLIVDYLQLMRGDGRAENRVQEMSNISRALKGLARELHVPVLALSQLSRAVESREDRQPQLSDLRDSGSIEQDADVVMFIYRDAMYYPTEADWVVKHAGQPYRPNIAEIRIAKQRNGPSGRKVELAFIQDRAEFGELQKERVLLNE